jgi:putative DNA primase/helicase
LGDYGHTAEPTLLMAKNGETHPTGTADLLGRGLVSTAETEQGRRFDIALLKRLTGGDTLKARFMRQDFFEFEPSHLLVMSTNHLPRIDDDTVAVWRRLRVIPFTVEIPESDWDNELKDKLRAEADTIRRGFRPKTRTPGCAAESVSETKAQVNDHVRALRAFIFDS